jgi:hypothetical protein
MLLGFDHFVVLVNCLDAAMGTYRRLRFDDGTYIELLAFKDVALVAQTFLSRPKHLSDLWGQCLWTFR